MEISLILIHALRLHEGKAKHPGGHFHHMRHLLQALVPHAAASRLKVMVLVDELGAKDLADVLPASCQYLAGKSGDGILRSEHRVRKAIQLLQPALYYRPTGQLPLGRLGCPAIMGVADLNFCWMKTPLSKRIYKEISYRWSFSMAERVVCISDFTRKDVASKFNVPDSKLRVVHHGAPVLPPPVRFKVNATSIWITFGHQAHKNVELCLRAMHLRMRTQAEEVLIVIGQSEHIEHVLKPMAAALGLERLVRFVGRVSAANLCWLYKEARGLLFVSKFEGFGLPVLEAMSAGCPVIASNVCSLPEIAGDAALLVPTDNSESLANAMNTLIADPIFAQNLISKGRMRAKLFTWDDTAQQTVKIIKEVLSNQNNSPEQ